MRAVFEQQGGTDWGVLAAAGTLTIIPGAIVTVFFMGYIAVRAIKRPSVAPKEGNFSVRALASAVIDFLPVAIIMVFVLGSVFAGWATATEAAAMGAAGSVAIAVAGRNVSVAKLWQAAQETVRTSCMVMVIVAGATVFGHFLALTGMPTQFAGWLAPSGSPSWPLADRRLCALKAMVPRIALRSRPTGI